MTRTSESRRLLVSAAERRARERAAYRNGWRAKPARRRKVLKPGPWKSYPSTPLPIARAVYRHLFNEPLPKGWTVEWVGYMRGALGLCDYGDKRVLLSHGDAVRRGGSVLRTLVHELIHVRLGPTGRHGKAFRELEDKLCRRLGIDTGHAVDRVEEEGSAAAVFVPRTA